MTNGQKELRKLKTAATKRERATPKDPGAVSLGRKGGLASAAALTPEQRRARASKAGRASAGTRLKCEHPMTPAGMLGCLRCYNRFKRRESRARSTRSDSA